MPTFELETQCHAAGYLHVCGVDEAGRGPLSGPVVAAACILSPDEPLEGVDDSKKLTEKKRERLYDAITGQAIAYGIGMASPEEIDRLNILNATMLAMRRAIGALTVPPDFALVDGNVIRDFPVPAKAVIRGDSLSYSIAAASILAKVTRDRICMQDALLYPEYHFERHKGYATKEHMDILRAIGPCPIHRRSFLGFLDQ